MTRTENGYFPPASSPGGKSYITHTLQIGQKTFSRYLQLWYEHVPIKDLPKSALEISE